MVYITVMRRQSVDRAVASSTEHASHLEVTSIETVVYWPGFALDSRSVGLYLGLYHAELSRSVAG